VDHGAQVINASWGGPGDSSAIRDAIAYANDHGVLFVTASGNDGRNSDTIANYPNNYNLPNILTVAATGSQDQMASFSNYGPSTVDLAAPGQAIYSTYANGGYEWLDGTSMACPMVAGAAALALSVDPGLGALELKLLLMETVDPLPSQSGYTVTGGRINVQALLAELGAPPQQDPPEDPPEDPPDTGDDPPQQGAWSYVAYPIASPHPYADDFNGQAVINQPGAEEIKLHFDRFELEQGYDFVELEDGHGNMAGKLTGHLGAFETDPVPGDALTIRLVTDYSVTDYGIDVAGYSWR
jgi:subtilisin family serine protease